MSLQLQSSPMAQWVRAMLMAKQFDPDEYASLVYVVDVDITSIFRRDLAHRVKNDRNMVLQIKGPTGSGKSTVGCAVARWLLPGWKPKGQVFYSDEKLIHAAQRSERNVVFIKDEDPKRHGQGQVMVDDMLANIESAVARWAQQHYIFINPYETGHLVHFVLDTSREQAQYSAPGILSKVVVDVKARDETEEGWFPVGKMVIDAPPENILQEYKQCMVRSKQALKDSGGLSEESDLGELYAPVIAKLAKDEQFRSIPLGRGANPLTQNHASYISRKYHVIRSDANLLCFVAKDKLLALFNEKQPQKPQNT